MECIMKKILFTSIIASISLFLSGCSNINFSNIELEQTPVWDTGFTQSTEAWGFTDKTAEDRGELSSSFIKLYNENRSCYIDGRILFDSEDNVGKSDLNNSRKYLENIGLQNTEGNGVSISETIINDIPYVVGSYVLPDSFGQYKYHKTAVRVFSTKMLIPNNVEENYGLPLVVVDMACKQKENITEEKWVEGSNLFKLVLVKKTEK